MDDHKKPGAAHADFARDLVAVCRNHQMRGLSATYRAAFDTGAYNDFSGQVTITWNEGRHGADGQIAVKFEGTSSFPEAKGSSQ